MRLDPLAAVFLALLGAASAGISLFSAGYFRKGEGALPGCCASSTTCSSPAWASSSWPTTPMPSWSRGETMALSSYFLVTTQHRIPDIRRAGFLYLLIAHLGAIGILLSFGVMQGGSWQFTFDAMRAAQLDRSGPRSLSCWRSSGSGQGRPGAAARVAARSAPCSTFAGVRADERRHAQDGHLRRAARDVRPAREPQWWWGWSRWVSACSRRSTAWCSPPCRPT